MDKRPYKRVLKQFDINVQRKRSLRSKNSFMNDTSSSASFYENDDKNKENKNPIERGNVYTTLFGDSPSTAGNLTDEINNCLPKHRNLSDKGSTRLTKESLIELQLLIREFEVQHFSGCDHLFCQELFPADNLCRCRTNFLFELDCYESKEMLEKGNMRIQCYCKKIYKAIDNRWSVSGAVDPKDQHEWEGLEWLVLPKAISLEKKPVDSMDFVTEDAELPKKALPATVLQIRSNNKAFEESINLSEIFKQWSSSSSSVSNWDAPNDSFEHCPSAKAKCALKKRILKPSDIVFPK